MKGLLTNADLMKSEKHCQDKMDKMVKQVMSNLGARGTGQSKIRGDSSYYKKIAAMRKTKKNATEKTLPSVGGK